MQQLRALQTATLAAVAVTATPAPSISVASDRQTLAQMIKNKQIPMAFETVSHFFQVRIQSISNKSGALLSQRKCLFSIRF